MDPVEAWHLLVVEDNEINREVVSQLLASRGYRVTAVEHGGEALEALARDGSIALVFMDVEMPVMDGLQATRALRADDRWARLPVIGLTAHASTDDLATFRAAGMDEVVVKPARLAELDAAARRFLAPLDPPPPRAVASAHALPESSALFARESLLATVEGDEAFLGELLALFLDDAPLLLADLGALVEAGDREGARRRAHGIKGAAANVSALAMRQAARRLEQAAAQDDEDLAPLLAALVAAWERTRARMAEELP